ncbi:hypothetical protein HPP92_028400, partial [Vanilla planifolia]
MEFDFASGRRGFAFERARERKQRAGESLRELVFASVDVVDVIKHDGVDKKSLKEANLDVMKDGVDGDGVGEVKDNENNENMEVVENEEVKEDLLYNEEQKKDAGDSLDGEVNKFAGEPLHVEKKHDEEAKEESEAVDATEVIGEVKDCVEKDNVGVNTEIEGKQRFQAKPRMNKGKSVTEGLRDIVDRNTMQSINDVKDSGEKNDQKDEQDDANDGKEKGDDNDVIGDNEKGIEEINVDKDDNVLVRLKDSKYMHEVQEVMDCEQKSEMETKINGETTKVNKIKDLMAMNMKVMNEDAAANERHEEKDNVRSVGYEEENAIEEDDVNRENDGNTENVSLKRKRSRERGNVEGKTKENTDAKEKKRKERPVRERKIVERLVEVIEKEPNRTVVIEKGRGTPLKDITNGMIQAIDFKNNLLQFSGFAWHESESSKSRKRKRDTKSNASKTSKGSPAENSMKKSAKTEDLVNSEEKISKDKENDDDDEVEKDTENGMPDEDDAPKQSESDAKESSPGKKKRKTMAVKKFSQGRKEMWSHPRDQNQGKIRRTLHLVKRKVSYGGGSKSGPSKTDLRKTTICEILKEVDFNGHFYRYFEDA